MYTQVSSTYKMYYIFVETSKSKKKTNQQKSLVQKLQGFLLSCGVLGTFITLAYQIVDFLSAEIEKSR